MREPAAAAREPGAAQEAGVAAAGNSVHRHAELAPPFDCRAGLSDAVTLLIPAPVAAAFLLQAATDSHG